MTQELSLQKIVGGGYNDFWKTRKRYCVVKGSRASKKSKTTALKIIMKMMQYPKANTLVVRKVERTLRQSCFSDLVWAINRLGVRRWWKTHTSPLEMEYTPTGQKIIFRGMDDPLKLASISVSDGYLCWVWIEEAYEISSEDDFDTLDESIRGEMPEGYYKQFILTFNPWNDRHWLKARFFDNPSDDVFCKTTNYLCNEFLDDADRKVFEDMKVRNPRRYQVAGLGNWGVVEGLVYENWVERSFSLEDPEVVEGESCNGLDFGYTNDPTAFVVQIINEKQKKLFVWDELYEKGLSNEMIFNRIKGMGYMKERMTADSAEPKSIDELHRLGLRIKGARKGKDSIMNGIQYLQNYEIVIHPRCVNFLTEIQNYQWAKDRFGKTMNAPIDDYNHLMDACRYGCEDHIVKKKWLI